MLLIRLEPDDEVVALEDIRVVRSEDEPLVWKNFPVDPTAVETPVLEAHD